MTLPTLVEAGMKRTLTDVAIDDSRHNLHVCVVSVMVNWAVGGVESHQRFRQEELQHLHYSTNQLLSHLPLVK